MELYQYIVAYVEEHGYQPMRDEMAQHFGCTGRAIFDRLLQLESKGMIKMVGGRNGGRQLKLNHLRFKAHLVN